MKVKLCGVAFGGWVCGLGVMASARWTWPGELAMHCQPYMGAAGLMLAALFAALSWKHVATLTGLVAALLLAPMLRFLPFRGAVEHVDPTLRVATANLHRDRPSNLDLEGWIGRHELDVIAFQEVSLPTMRRLRELLGSNGSLELLPRDEEQWTHGTYGQVLFSRHPIEDVERVREAWIGPGFFIARIQVDGEKLNLIAAHPTRPGRAEQNEARDAALAVIAERAASLKRVVVFGDLNTTGFSTAFSDLLADGELRDSRVGIGWQPSFAPMDKLPLRIPLFAIDHVLVSDGLVVVDRERTENLGSDHWPIIATIGLTP